MGYNYRLTNLQAAVGCAQLERSEQFIEKKRWIAEQYRQRLESTALQLPAETADLFNVYWLYTVLLPKGFSEEQRDALIQHLDSDEIESRPFFYPLHKMPPYQEFASHLPNSESISPRGITLPSYY